MYIQFDHLQIGDMLPAGISQQAYRPSRTWRTDTDNVRCQPCQNIDHLDIHSSVPSLLNCTDAS